MAIEKLLRHIVNSTVGQAFRKKGVVDRFQVLGFRPATDRIMDRAGLALVDHQPVTGLDELQSVRLLVHEQIGEAAFAALTCPDGQFFVEQLPVRKGNRTESAEINFHSTPTRYCLPEA